MVVDENLHLFCMGFLTKIEILIDYDFNLQDLYRAAIIFFLKIFLNCSNERHLIYYES